MNPWREAEKHARAARRRANLRRRHAKQNSRLACALATARRVLKGADPRPGMMNEEQEQAQIGLINAFCEDFPDLV